MVEDDSLDKQRKHLAHIEVDFEREIIGIIQRGAETTEMASRRPIRELIQNADDAHSDRVHLRFDKSGVTFENDGLGLKGVTVLDEDGNETIEGTV